jgi:hypothetical protein
MNYTLKEIQNGWNTTILNRTMFLMIELKFTQSEAEVLAKKEFKEIKEQLKKQIKGV